MQTTPQRRHGRGSSGPESLFKVNGRSRKSKSRRSSKVPWVPEVSRSRRAGSKSRDYQKRFVGNAECHTWPP